MRAGEGGEQLVLALAFERDDAGDLAVAEVEGDVVELGADAQVADAEARAGRRTSRRAGWRCGRRRGSCSMRAPSISSTMRSSTPGAMSTTPTVSPSRSTVARSQSAEISRKRCEMKMTERPASLWRRTTSSTRSARLAGSAAVISSSSSTSGSTASARARSRTRRTASGMSRAVSRRSRSGTPSSRDPVAERRDRRAGEAKVDGDVEIGDQRRLLVDRDQAGAARVGGRAHVAGLAADEDAAGIGADGAGQDLDQRRLAGAVGAHQRVHLAGQDRERRVAQRRDGAVVLGDAGGVEERVAAVTGVRDACRSGYVNAGTPGRRPRRSPRRGLQVVGDYSPGPLQATIWSLV